MKRKCFTSLMVLTTFLWSSTAAAHDAEMDGVYYNLNKETKTATVTYKTNENGDMESEFYSGTLEIESSVYIDEVSYQVTEIGDHAFWNCPYLKTLIIRCKSMTLGKQLFSNTGIQKLEIYSSNELTVTADEDGHSSFWGLDKLDELLLYAQLNCPKGVAAFKELTSLRKVTIGKDVAKLPEGTFALCTGLRTINSQSLTPPACGDDGTDVSVFQGIDPNQVKLQLHPDAIASYKAHAVWGIFTNIDAINIGEFYGFEIYRDYDRLNWVDFSANNEDGIELFYQIRPDGTVWLTGIPAQRGNWISRAPYYRKTVKVPSKVTNKETGNKFTVSGIYHSCFMNDPILTTCTLPETIDTLDTQAFADVENMHSIDLPEGLKYIGQCALGYSFWDTSGEAIGLTGELRIPSTVTTLGSTAFRYSAVEKFIFPEESQLDSIGDYCFFGCPNIKELKFPSKLRALSMAAIANNPQLTRVELPNSVEVMDGNCLAWNPLESFTLPAGVKKVTFMTFQGIGFAGKQNLANCTLKEISVDEGNTVYDSRNKCNAVIETSTNTLIFGSNVSSIPESVKSIASNSFMASKIETITLPAGLESIEPNAFNSPFPNIIGTIDSKITTPAGILKGNAFNNTCLENTILRVPVGTKAAYESDEEWNKFKNIVEAAPATPGDLTGDGIVTAKDAILLVMILTGVETDIQTTIADMNNDGVVNVADIIILINGIE